MDWAEKIRYIEKELGIEGDRGRLASLLGVRPGIISDVKRGKAKKPGADLALLLINKLGVNPNWLDKEIPPPFMELKKQPFGETPLQQEVKKTTFFPLLAGENGDTIDESGNEGTDSEGKEPMKPGVERTEYAAPDVLETARRKIPLVVEGGEEGLLIPVYAQGLSAGTGYDYDEGETVRYIKVPAWIARQGRNLVAFPVYGESMEPTISSGDLVVCDSGGFCGDGVYMIRDEDRGLTFCKRILWTPGGWTIKSDNSGYDPVKVDDRAIKVIARIIGAVKGIK
jgi:SOS-response transcriptional repressor LexA